ncbi:MAG: hypothetical protein CRU78_17580 [Candidatus Accumulibacter phosphatis]|uniref:Uncharacterized protein n=2 Tax=Candidatus Accumulibacter TaxID=327159 RepID=A0A6A7RXK3_9PROT|nr:hypothetical protein [Candidatus Accumulibacter phosphatis]
MMRVRVHSGLPLVLLGVVVYALVLPALYARPRQPVSPEMEVAMPRFVQVLTAAGDRFLAANLATFRALVVSTETMSAENYRILGIVESDAAWLNPAQEDNYYIAAGILPWVGEVAATQYILRQATDARLFDSRPPFFYAFNELHFLKNPVEGAKWLLTAARHTEDQMEQIQLQQMAALWVSKGEDVEFAIRLHRAMAKETRHKAFALFLDKRAVRLENLLLLDRAIISYTELTGQLPTRLEQLVDKSILPAIPSDPFSIPYFIDSKGKAQPVQGSAVASGRAP